MIIQISVDLPVQLTKIMVDRITNFLEEQKIPYYVDPASRYQTLKEVEIECESK